MSDRAFLRGKPVPMQMLRTWVFTRDGSCFAFRVERGHECTDQWGRRHSPYDHSKLTLEHVTMVHWVSEGRVTDEKHTVPLCAALNGVGIAPARLRHQMRSHLLRLYPSCVDSPG